MMTCDNPRGSPAEGSKRSLPPSNSLPPWPVNVGALQRLCRLIVNCAMTRMVHFRSIDSDVVYT